ncbi:protein FAR1-RELATED SEQUENCE 5-like [Prunus persica]|uniref:protein FAR1-RELATED SEQUENCE 5-like n=1 Tax=Prunus persica TaxID=3760 RepID=UPI0009AB88D9|nr:protein FAR1-RELATED SEQUENCE 5-like [Prunus persica]
MSGGSESDECATVNGRVYIPEVRNEETPAIGMKFDSLDLIYNFYNRYAFLAGFDATSRRAYGFYGDVVVFDTTFNTNRYDLTFAPMLGVNNHGQTIVLACAFLSKEMIESFVWMFKEFKKAMPGGESKTIITDQDAAMAIAISIAFPTTFHRLCIWHITSKFSAKLPHSAYKEYWREFQKAIWDTDNKDEFDAKWNIVVTKAGLTDHPWLSSMFDLRESWVPAYARQFFAAGMSSSQRAEGSHGFFKQYISRRNSLMDFIIRFERALSHQHEKELVADHVDAFEVAQSCFLELKTEDASKVVFNMSERKTWETRVAEVVYVKDSDHASCSCKRFEFVRIICKHILALFRRDQIEYMPDKYILKRWKKTAKSGLVSDTNGNEIKDCTDPGLLIKRCTMSRLASDVVEDALMSEEGCELLSETLKSLQVKLKLLKDGPSNNEVGGSSSQTQYMKDPKRVRCKGRSKGVTGAKEKAMKRGIRHCRECGHIGHDRRQCPRNLNTPTSPSNNDESTPIYRSDPLFDEFDRMHRPTE